MQHLGPIPSRVKLTLKLGKCEPAVMFNKLRPERCRAEVLLEALQPAGEVGEAQLSSGALAVCKSCRFQAPVLLRTDGWAVWRLAGCALGPFSGVQTPAAAAAEEVRLPGAPQHEQRDLEGCH